MMDEKKIVYKPNTRLFFRTKKVPGAENAGKPPKMGPQHKNYHYFAFFSKFLMENYAKVL